MAEHQFQVTIKLRFQTPKARTDERGAIIPVPALPAMTEDEARLSLRDRILLVAGERLSLYAIADQFPGWELLTTEYETTELGADNAV